MMKYIIIVALMVIAIQAYPQQDVVVVSEHNDAQEDGSYNFGYELSDKTRRSESGRQVKLPGTEDGGIEITGSYGHNTPEGKSHSVDYTAGAAGSKFRIVSTR